MTSHILSASDLANFLACQHLTNLDRAEAAGEIRRPFFPDPSLELLQKLGLKHEQKYLESLQSSGKPSLVEIPVTLPTPHAAAKTIEALRSGADVVYQPVLFDAPWKGRADFLIRVEKPSALGTWSYEVVEAKLARSTKARALIQLCFYSDLLSRIQGIEPQWMYVALGGGKAAEEFQVQRYLAYFRKVRREFEAALKIGGKSYPEPVEHCDVCDWWPNCDARLRADDHLSLVAGISRNQRKALLERNVGTVVQLGQLPLPAKPKIERIGEAALVRIREQARIQVAGRDQQQLIHELLEPVELERGLAALPEPSPGDLFLDLEADSYAFDQGIEYLFGVVSASLAGEEPSYSPRWCLSPAAEKEAFVQFIASVMERWRQYPGMHIYHYAPYEPTAIKRLAGRHGVCVDEVDQLLRAEIFVDLYQVVRQGLRASVESYSIKKMEPLYGFTRAVALREATQALQAFEAVLALGDEREDIVQLRTTIEGYNRDDCFSTLRLREWLEERRRELEERTGQPVPRPAAKSGAPTENLEAEIGEVRAVMARLLAGVPADEKERTAEQSVRWLLAQMLEWHRREEKSAWWEYFRLLALTDEELQEDKSALGGLRYVGEAGRVDRSIIHRYWFPPQDHAIGPGTGIRDPKTEKRPGEVVAVDERNWTIDLKRGAKSPAPHPEALIPFDDFGSKEQRASLLRLGNWVAGNGIDGPGPYRAARDLLLCLPPRLGGGWGTTPLVNPGEPLLEAGKRLALAVKASVLPVQGPPGSGKTYSGARMIVELVKSGKRVGITAVSHKVISNLLREVLEAATEAGVRVSAVQKANDEDGYENPRVQQAGDNPEVLDALTGGAAQVAAGTAWLWSRGDMADSVDVLFVDEAGQMSLANVLAVSQAARSVVLLGDPQQLDQPQKGVHPPGAEVSALAHLLKGRPTLSDDRGLFLSETWRLPPDVCAFTSELFYEGRLKSRPENQNQRLNAEGSLGGTGLRFVPVEHTGNQSESAEEAEGVKELVGQLLRPGTTWTNKKGEPQPVTLEDILIVAPYNAHVSLLTDQLPPGARVGTVDKFQGQEAPVVIYSMATSTPEDAPRGMEFLYSLNRLNVATSRAQCVTVLVASPALFNVQCKSPRQMELANAFCRYLEMARAI